MWVGPGCEAINLAWVSPRVAHALSKRACPLLKQEGWPSLGLCNFNEGLPLSRYCGFALVGQSKAPWGPVYSQYYEMPFAWVYMHW